MRTVGVDLAAEPKGTAVAIIDWSSGSARLSKLVLGATDDKIVALTVNADKVGIDCALGWPVDFVSFLQRQTNMDSAGDIFDGGIDWRRSVAYRETDRHVREVTGRWPLSVATDRLGMTALRCSGLLSRFRHSGVLVDRAGTGLLVEIYPGATIRIWGFYAAGYRNSPEVRGQVLSELHKRAPWFGFKEFRNELVQSCDSFDALFAALAARSAALGYFEPPTENIFDVAKSEGWIALPNRSLESLLPE